MPDIDVLDYLTDYPEPGGAYTLRLSDRDDYIKYRILVMQKDPYWFIFTMILEAYEEIEDAEEENRY